MSTDEELIATCKTTSFEEKVEKFGCFATLIVAWALFGLLKIGEPKGWAIVIAVALTLLTLTIPVIAFLPYRRRAGAALKELKSHYPFPTRDKLHKYLADKIQNCPQAEWIVLLNVSLLPHGGRLYIEFDATNETTASLKILRAPFSWSDGKAASKSTLNLAPEHARELWALLPAARECSTEKLVGGVMDGAPAHLLGWNRASNGIFQLECNFSSPTFRVSTSALAKLASRLTQFQNECERRPVASYNGKEIVLEGI